MILKMLAPGMALGIALAGCGTGNTASIRPTAAMATGTTTTATARPHDVHLAHAWVRLRQETYFVHPGDRVRMLLDIVSSDKPVDRAEARWRAWDGRFDRWITRTPWLDNEWTAPDRAGGYRMDVDLEIRYTDGTSDREDLNEIVWVR